MITVNHNDCMCVWPKVQLAYRERTAYRTTVKLDSCIVHILVCTSFIMLTWSCLIKGQELVLANLHTSKSLKRGRV